MALKSRFSGLHLVFRMLGLTGLLALGVAGMLWNALPSESEEVVQWIALGGAAAVGLALLVEMRGVLRLFGSRRVALGSNVAAQVVLALGLVAGLNVWSFHHYRRLDWTWDRSFTLDEKLREQLANLRSATDIVVFQRDAAFQQRSEGKDKDDLAALKYQLASLRYDLAAHKKIVEKVKDLGELFQDLGPRFRVQVLDVQDDNFDDKMDELEARAPALAAALVKAPENSIFFHAGGKVQRLAFHDVYQIDKVASQEDGNGRGNLVLNFQGVDPIARKILNIEEKPPRLAAAVVHPVLTMSDPDNLYLTMNGAKKALEAHGFDTKDLLMRKMEESGGLSPDAAVLTFEEGRYEQVEEELALLNDSIGKRAKDERTLAEELQEWKTQSLEKLNKKYAYIYFAGGGQGVILRSEVESFKKKGRPFKVIDVDDEDKEIEPKARERDLLVLQNILEMERRNREALLKEKKTLSADELGEKRRISDIEVKMARELADRDLLIIPRFTVINVPRGDRIPNRVHKLDEAQLRALRHFLRKGKSVLFLLGPTNEPDEEGTPFREPEGDELEKMLADLGFTLPKQTILFNVEARDYNERKVGVMFAGRETEIPSVKFDWQPEAVKKGKETKAPPHPVRASLNLTSRAVGKPQAMELRMRHPRPVYVQKVRLGPAASTSVIANLSQPGWAGALGSSAAWLGQGETVSDDSAVLFVTSEDSWNEEQPFITKKGVPRYEPTKEDDKTVRLETERRGPFPIGVALERPVPSSWIEDGKAPRKAPRKARVAVIGHGGVFTGQSLSPIKEKLLLDVVNWLVGRDDLLARQSEEPWRYPRVQLAGWEMSLWQWGARLALPLLFVYLGAMMWLVRRMR